MIRSWSDRHDEKIELWLEFHIVHESDNDGDTLAPAVTPAFTCFGALPTELRLKIWEDLIQPRIVLAACLNSRLKDGKRAQLAQRPKKRSVPVLLHVNHESRNLALQHYQLAFSWKIPPPLAWPQAGVLPSSSEARVWFNFELDALLLLGKLEPYDQHGFSAPMVYFLREDDTRRVRHVACAFEELRPSLYESDELFGRLRHITDTFPAAQRLLITCMPQDAEVRLLVHPIADNAVQKLWCAFMNGTTSVTSTLAGRQILMIRKDDLAAFITEHK